MLNDCVPGAAVAYKTLSQFPIIDVVRHVIPENGQERPSVVVTSVVDHQVADHVQFLDAIFLFQKSVEKDSHFLIPEKLSGIIRRVAGIRNDNNRQWIRNAESIGVVDVVDGNAIRLARIASVMLVDQLKSEFVVFFDVDNVVDELVDELLVDQSSVSQHQNCPTLLGHTVGFAQREALDIFVW